MSWFQGVLLAAMFLLVLGIWNVNSVLFQIMQINKAYFINSLPDKEVALEPAGETGPPAGETGPTW